MSLWHKISIFWLKNEVIKKRFLWVLFTYSKPLYYQEGNIKLEKMSWAGNLFCIVPFVTITYTWSVTVSFCHGFLSVVCHYLILSRYFLSMICHGLTLSQFFVRGLSQSHFVSLVTQLKKIIRAILRGFIVRGRAPRTRQNFIVTCVSAVCHDYDKHRTWYF